MKRYIFFIMFFLSIFTITGCGVKKSEFQKFIDRIPDIISKDYVLPETFKHEKIIWKLDNQELEDNRLEFIYSDEDLELSLVAIVKNDVAMKTVKIKKTNFVTELNINTTNNLEITSKEDYLRANLKISDAGFFNTEIESARIRGRGNSTWGYEKKPYRIKFDTDTSILGMKPATDYVLLAEHNDKSLMRNYIAHYFSRFLNLPHQLETRYVRLVLNGDYKGLYLLTEQVAVSENRLNIDTSDDIDGGFLLEFEREFDRANAEGKENVDWFRMKNPNPNDRNNNGNTELYQEVYYVVKSPKIKSFDKNIQESKINYYKEYINKFEQSVSSDEYDKYINVDSFIDYFVLTELMKQVDIGYSSVYIVKDKNEKMQMGPIWDFDISSGNGNYYAYGPKGFWSDYNPWFGILIKNNSFKEKYISRFNEIIDLYFSKVLSEIDRVLDYITIDAKRNFKRWDMFMNDGFNPNPIEMLELKTHDKQVEYLKSYLTERKNWILKTLNNEGYIGYLGEEDEGWR
ncbi:CotH kinase family protein [Haploplasma modicum]|uniref:CotH kinase family protein n=1 Tax=Haploplasma modicum TaxID=2150 RepID=UPI00214C0C0A|nr:CotH kinase family protein [Haploplasma modicum]MCR1808796.1 CotH kinase family protein [Haploplasma modicum]